MMDFQIEDGVLLEYTDESGETEVIIPDDVTAIEADAFSFCEDLTKIVIPASVSYIGDAAFEHCTHLKSIVIPGKLTHLGECIFKDCWALESVTFEGSLDEEDDDPDESISTNEMFRDCVRLERVQLPEGIQRMGNAMFRGCIRLASIAIPDTVAAIGDNCFASCTALKEVTFSCPTTSIGVCAFAGCNALEKIELPSLCQSVGSGVFNACKNLRCVIVPDGWKTVPALTRDPEAYLAMLPDPNLACEPDEEVMPNANREYAMHFLSHKDQYNAENAKKRMEYIDSETELLTEIAVERNNAGALSELLLLKKADAPLIDRLLADAQTKQKTEIVAILMEYRNSLDESANVQQPDDTFSLKSCITAAEAKRAWKFSKDNTLGGMKLTAYLGGEQDVAVPEYIDDLPVVTIGAKTFAGQSSVKSVLLPTTLKVLPAGAFRDCKELIRVTLPEGIEAIEKQLFYNCGNLKNADIPASVSRIEKTAFTFCYALEEYVVAENNPNFAVYNGILCSKDGAEVLLIPEGMKTIRIPDGIKKLKGMNCASSAFDTQHIYIPASVKKIDWSFVGANPEDMDIIIHGKTGSEAEKYAKELGYSFEKM